MNTPHLYQISDLVKQTREVATLHPEAGWIPCRPIGFQGLSLRRRLALAWGVFTGRYDAIFWEPRLKDVKFDEAFAQQHVPHSVTDEDAGAAALLAASTSFN